MKRSFSSGQLRWLTVLVCGTVLYFLANVHRVAMPGAVFDRLCALYGCTPAGVTALGAVFMYSYALMQPMTGLLLERYGSGRVLAAGVFAFVTGEFLFALGDTLPVAYCGQILAGLGVGTLYLTLLKENLRLFPVKYNLTLSIIILVGHSGSICSNAPYVAAVNWLGLQKTMLLQAVCAGSLWLVCLILILAGGLPAVDRRHTFSPREFLPVLQKRSNLAIYLFFGLNFGLYYVLQTVIGKKFLQDFCNMGEMNAGWVFSTTGALTASGGFIFAVLGQFLGARRYLFCRLAGVVSVLVFTVLTFMIAADMRNGMLCSLLILLLSCFASLTTVLIPILNESNPPSIIGRCMSILNFSCYIAVAMLGNMTGMILNCFSPTTQDGSMACSRSAWLTLFAALTCCSLLVCFFSFRFGKTAAISHNPGHENAEKN